MRKIYITLGVLFLGVIAMAYLYFSNLNTEANANNISLNAVAKEASLVFSFDNDKSFYEILRGQDLLQNILGEKKSKELKSLRENLIENHEIFNQLDGQKIYIGILPGLENTVDFLISTQLKANSDPIKVLDNLKSSKIKIEKVKDIYKLSFTDSTNCFVGIKDKLILISNSASTIENNFTNQKIEKGFVDYVKANSRFNKNTLANLYINFNNTPLLLKNLLNSSLTGELHIFSQQNTYVALSYNFSKEKLLFNGNTDVNDNNYFKLFSKIPEQKININVILPTKTANYAIYAINDYTSWRKQLMELQTGRSETEKLNKNIANINQTYRLDIEQIFIKYCNRQFVSFQLNTGEKFGAVALNDGEKLNQLLLDLSAEYATDIRIFKEANIPYIFFGDPFKKFERPFYTIIDNYLVMANNASSINSFLNSYSNGDLLINNEDYRGLTDQLSTSATISFYVNNKNSNDIFGRNLKRPYYKQYQSKDGFKYYDAFSYQLSGGSGRFLSNVLLYKKAEKVIEPDTLNTN
ncbi:hypothetical protein EZ428_15650 [Pedobacter frigiditerrae]|uniref:DUF3352 domain-containing protein n=1 Tax=Pedobacter frigiditerrae TaxID=2530452 RepID=A0A4R0MQJ6_9SPHI|nr:hypothetical protein [Pedobacter frigiditerrae]TCC89135.1 hypothetical protein EZ428_15650 [Pedobacter frigiditerrae]